MITDLTMPSLSPTMEYGTLARWLVKAGDQFQAGDRLAEIETDKATMEVEASEAGIIDEILVVAGTEDVVVGTLIARFRAQTAQVAAVVQPEPESRPETLQPRAAIAADTQLIAAADQPALALQVTQLAHTRFSPLANCLARRFAVDPQSLLGAAPNRLITRKDVLALLPNSELAPQQRGPASEAPAPASRRPMPCPTPHAIMTIECKMGALLRFKERLNVFQRNARADLIPLDAIIVKIQANALSAEARHGAEIIVSTTGRTGTATIVSPHKIGLAAIATQFSRGAATDQATYSFDNHSHLGIRQSIPSCGAGLLMALSLGAHDCSPEPQEDDVGCNDTAILTGVFSGSLAVAPIAAAVMRDIKSFVEAPDRLML